MQAVARSESGRRGVVRDVGGALIQKLEVFVEHVVRPLGPRARSGTDRYIASRVIRDIKLRTDPERLRVQALRYHIGKKGSEKSV